MNCTPRLPPDSFPEENTGQQKTTLLYGSPCGRTASQPSGGGNGSGAGAVGSSSQTNRSRFRPPQNGPGAPVSTRDVGANGPQAGIASLNGIVGELTFYTLP